MNAPLGLVILDGFGHSAHKEGNAIKAAHTPMLDYLYTHYPHTLLRASGTAVGLPEGFMGNSEVGHLAIGTGKIIPQPLTLLLDLIASKSFSTHPSVVQIFEHAQTHTKRVHIIGLLSDAGAHCHYQLLAAYMNAAREYDVQPFLHLFTDGRDTLAYEATELLARLRTLTSPTLQPTTLSGRFYGMDRNNNYDRTYAAYDALTNPEHDLADTSPEEFLEQCYQQGYTDETIPPARWNNEGIIKPGDTVIIANIRLERTHQLVELLQQPTQHPIALFYTANGTTDTPHPTVIPPHKITTSLRTLLHQYNKTVLLSAESEKVAHITTFLGTSLQEALDTESVLIIPSIVTESYADYPRMSADTITYFIRHSFRTNPRDVYIINYANADMIGHTGDFDATVWAIECLDDQLALLYETFVKKYNGRLIITADHGNAEQMIDACSKQPDPRHTNNMVPFIYTNKNVEARHQVQTMHQLSDIYGFIVAQLEC